MGACSLLSLGVGRDRPAWRPRVDWHRRGCARALVRHPRDSGAPPLHMRTTRAVDNTLPLIVPRKRRLNKSPPQDDTLLLNQPMYVPSLHHKALQACPLQAVASTIGQLSGKITSDMAFKSPFQRPYSQIYEFYLGYSPKIQF